MIDRRFAGSDRQRVFSIAKVTDMQAHAVHEGDVQAAEFAVWIGAVVVEAAALNAASAATGEDDGELS